RLLLTVDVQVALRANVVRAVLGEINLLDNLTGKSGLGVPFTFHIVLIEVLPLKFAVKTPEGHDVDQKSKLIVSGINQSREFIRSRFYHFERSIGREADG